MDGRRATWLGVAHLGRANMGAFPTDNESKEEISPPAPSQTVARKQLLAPGPQPFRSRRGAQIAEGVEGDRI
jgi:hypothetical protein